MRPEGLAHRPVHDQNLNLRYGMQICWAAKINHLPHLQGIYELGLKLRRSQKSEPYVNDESRPEGSGFQRLLLTRPFIESGRVVFG